LQSGLVRRLLIVFRADGTTPYPSLDLPLARAIRGEEVNGVELVVPLSCEAAPTEHSSAYLRTKKERMGHVLNLWKRHAAWHAG